MANNSGSSLALSLARIAVGVMFLFFAQYKLMHKDFAHGGYQKWVSGWVEHSSVEFYKPFLRVTLRHPTFFGYATGMVELAIGLSMIAGFWVRPLSIVAILYLLNLIFATWRLPPGTPAWQYLGAELDHIPLLLLFVIFYVHRAGTTLGLDKG